MTNDFFNNYIFVQTFQWTSSEFFFNFRFSRRKSQRQQKLAKKINYFTIRFWSKDLNLLNNEKNMLPQHSQKPFLLYKFSSKHLIGARKKHLHCTISRHPRTAFLEHFESKCQYISVYLRKKILIFSLRQLAVLGLVKCFTIFHFA